MSRFTVKQLDIFGREHDTFLAENERDETQARLPVSEGRTTVQTFDVYVTELWTRRYSVDAESEEAAIAMVKDQGDDVMAVQLGKVPGMSVGDPELETTFDPDGTEVDAKALCWTVEKSQHNISLPTEVAPGDFVAVGGVVEYYEDPVDVLAEIIEGLDAGGEQSRAFASEIRRGRAAVAQARRAS